MRSGILDRYGIEVKVGDVIVLPEIDFNTGGYRTDLPGTEVTVIFKHGSFGYEIDRFIPLFEWSGTEYIVNQNTLEYINVINDIYPFYINNANEETKSN